MSKSNSPKKNESDTKSGYYNIRKLLKFKNQSQKNAFDIIRNKRISFLCGPAGTAKSFLGIAAALDAYYKGEISKIILTRPMVEAAGERMGFLPGSLEEKIHPYLMPLFDLLENFIENKEVEYHMAQKSIEICPLAFMRGRTFKDACVVADEFQNANFDQIKMLTSRIGEGTRMIITGDSMQSDLRSGCCFDKVAKGLSSLDFVGYYKFTNEDIVREKIIGELLDKLEYIKNGK